MMIYAFMFKHMILVNEEVEIRKINYYTYPSTRSFLSDGGSHFNNQMIAQLLDNFQITHNFSTPYHPQTNGLVERFNRTLCESLAKLSINTNEWDKYISPVLFAYRTSKQSTTKITPFYLTYGREAKLPIDDLSENVEQIEQRIQNLLDILLHERESAIKRIEVQQFKQKQRYDQHVRHEIDF